jgi:hypothetical protein
MRVNCGALRDLNRRMTGRMKKIENLGNEQCRNCGQNNNGWNAVSGISD